MGYEQLRTDLGILDDQIASLKLKASPDAITAAQLNLVRDFLKDEAELPSGEVYRKWDSRFKEYYDAQIAIRMLSDAIVRLLPHQKPQLTAYLKKILTGSITQGGTPEQARDFYYELWLAALLVEAGFTLELREPDIVIEGNGLAQPIGIACKYPSSEAKIHENISKGYSQLEKNGLKGFVAIGFDQLLFKITGLEGSKFLDLRQSDRHPQELCQSVTDQVVTNLVENRSKLFPSEAPLNEIMVTVSLAGIFGEPAEFTFVGAVSFCTTPDCEIANDIQTTFAALHKLPSFSARSG